MDLSQMSLCELPVEQFGKLNIDSDMKPLEDLTSGGHSSSSKTSSEVSEISRSLANVTLSRKEVVPSSSRRRHPAGNPSSSISLDPLNASVNEERDSAGFKLPRRDNKRKRTMDEAATVDVDVDIEKPPGLSFALTPYRALAKLSGCDFRIELRCGMKQDSEIRDPHLWQCVITCADLTVKAESSRRDVAKEVASNELLSHLPRIHPDCHIPENALIPELFIDPQVIERDLQRIFKMEDVDSSLCLKQVSEYGTNTKRSRCTFFIYHFTFSVGTEKFEAEHHIVGCAKALAMKKVYMKFMGKEPASVPYFTGENCNSSQIYDFLETEIYRNVNPAPSLNARICSQGI